MQFSKTELKAISELGKGNGKISGIAKALRLSTSQAYRVAQELKKKGIVTLARGVLHPEMKTHVSMMLKLLSKAANLSSPISGTGLQIYTAILEPKTATEIQKETGLHKTTVIKKLNQGRKMSLVSIENKTYAVNEKIWPDAKDCLLEVKRYEESVDPRIPVNSVIYFKNSKEIVFSNKEDIDAAKTAFSAYEEYGIGLLLITNYYCLPKRTLTKKEIFTHSLYVAEKEMETRHIIFIALFYSKFRKELSTVKHRILENIERVLAGEEVPRFPTLPEIKDRARVYGIEVHND